ncbi:hypothetical protein Hypma_014560 [Hypsizygus marmoreus]|uniref:Uncharacterized protein n=1 Tax=Hypsizygus marmoreus TaxID=39966 RepID=A0A369JA92_HYPMA|nr:hypothetical protein Hypma_014560 [Hypsizygus marmoreus]
MSQMQESTCCQGTTTTRRRKSGRDERRRQSRRDKEEGEGGKERTIEQTNEEGKEEGRRKRKGKEERISKSPNKHAPIVYPVCDETFSGQGRRGWDGMGWGWDGDETGMRGGEEREEEVRGGLRRTDKRRDMLPRFTEKNRWGVSDDGGRRTPNAASEGTRYTSSAPNPRRVLCRHEHWDVTPILDTTPWIHPPRQDIEEADTTPSRRSRHSTPASILETRPWRRRGRLPAARVIWCNPQTRRGDIDKAYSTSKREFNVRIVEYLLHRVNTLSSSCI